ncbi:BTAD domain-containing putative transcriptional regulator [Actinosynnema sp. NPDC050801]|uniref:AfsR/SARP family transcriptional regulator n=1 Tax=unclassified Actinosynnema TaxID=2637065 RepID=UPI0033D89555
METGFKVLGPLEVWHGGEQVPLPTGKARVLLACLLLRAGRVVPVDLLADRLWDDGSLNPARTRATLHMVVTRLRQALGPANVVRTATGGYVADVPPRALDLHRFRDLAAAGDYAEALELWRGAPLSDVRSDVLHREEVAPLLEEHLVVLERRIDADLDAGRAGELVAELRTLTGQHPLRERFWGQLMLALYRSDQQAAALAAFRAVRAMLVEELGVDPGPTLTDLYDRILRDDVPGGPVVAPPRQALRHVPPEVSLFVGRERELAALDEAAREPGAVVLLHGIGGVGKTALASSWASRRRDRFGDGDLHVNLRGFDAGGRPVEPASAAEALLVSLGVRPEEVPSGLEARTALLRATLAGRRMLLVLDNAADSDQVLPLLPGTPTVTVLVTSRNQLRRLTAHHGVRRIALRQLSPAESTELLSSVLGRDRMSADPVAGRQVVERCTGLPLALRVFAERVARFPGTPMGAFAAELADERSRLDHLSADDGDDTDVRSVFFWSYRASTPDVARMFRLLSVHPGPDIGVLAAAALAGVPGPAARRQLERLTADHLLDSRTPGRYEFHDLLRAYSRELSDAEDDRTDALRALVEWYVRAAEAAAARTPSYRPRAGAALPAEAAEFDIGPVADPGEWGRYELLNLAAVTRVAAERGWHEQAWRISDAVWWIVDLLPRGDDLVRIFLTGHDSVRETSLSHLSGIAVNHLAWIYSQVNRHDAAVDAYERGLAIAVRDGDRRLEGVIEANLGGAYSRIGRYEEAVEHLSRGLAVARDQDDHHRQAAAHFNLAYNLLRLYRYEDSLEHGRRARALFDGQGDEYHSARTTSVTAAACRAMGRFTEAESFLREGISALTAFADPLGQSYLFDELGTVLLCLDRRAEALESWRKALAIYDEYERDLAGVVRLWLDDCEGCGTDTAGPSTGRS